jgi:hypothetical protein
MGYGGGRLRADPPFAREYSVVEISPTRTARETPSPPETAPATAIPAALENEAQLAAIACTPFSKVQMHCNHPLVGKVLHIEYQQRTEDGSCRHPRWDHLDGE